MNNCIDERAVLRFASGEMSENEENTFIAYNELAGEGARWREAVLTFVEHRRVVSALAEFATESSTTHAISRSCISIAPDHNHRKNMRWFTPLAALTSLAAGLLIGLAAGHFRELPGDAGPGSETSVAKTESHPAQVAQAEASRQANATAVPLQSASPQDASIFGLEPIIREDQVMSLRQQGFQVEEQPTIYLIDGSNGRKWVVPTQKATVRYVSR